MSLVLSMNSMLASISQTRKYRRVGKTVVVISQMLKNNYPGCIWHFTLVVRKIYLHRRVVLFTSWTHRKSLRWRPSIGDKEESACQKDSCKKLNAKYNMAGCIQHFVLAVRKRYLHRSILVLTLWTHGVASASTSIYRWQEESACRKDN